MPVVVTGITDAVTVTNGWGHACTLLKGGTVQCWGSDAGSWAGSATPHSTVPVTVAGLTGVTAVSADLFYMSALLTDKSVRCWGSDGAMLHQSVTFGSTVPVVLAGLGGTTNVTMIANGADHLCLLLEGGTAQCWIQDTTHHTQVPVQIVGVTSALQIASSEDHDCALLAGGTIECWGRNDYGQLGDGTTVSTSNSLSLPSQPPPSKDVPVAVTGISNAIAVAAGLRYTCAVLSDGEVQCWGLNDSGQLGNGTTTNSLVPITVSGL